MKYVDTKSIQAFVDKIERKKRYKRDAGLVLRHLFEECGELSAALYRYESDFKFSRVLRMDRKDQVAKEICDVIFLAIYIADILKIDLNQAIPKAMVDVATQYQVRHKLE